jgi:Tol biopolymer transport system component
MPLIIGSRVGPYEVMAPLGAGGMGEVFRARDTRLGRDVAIKVLPAAFAADPERLGRFEREARLLASLSHPNIAGIHGLEVIDGHRHLVLEFVDGVTLAARLAHGPLPVDESLAVGRQIAAALDAAHEAGIIHRDLKPGNVMLTATGDVKVLDFGLARGGSAAAGAVDQGLSASPTLAYSGTVAGVILGTAAYMSPEQARGRAMDRRTDIWSFGCVLYECLTGKSLFGGETISDTIAKILEREPDWSALPPRTPPRVRELLRRCLDKDPKKRQRDAGDIRLELDEVLAAGIPASGAIPAAGAGERQMPSSWLPWAVAAVAIVVALSALFLPRPGHKGPAQPPIRATIRLPRGATLLNHEACDIALSPDGTLMAFVAPDSLNHTWLWIRPLDNLEARQLARIEGAVGLPFWSPDSRRVAFFSDAKLKFVGLEGNPPQILCDAPDGRGGTWNADGTILFTPTSTGPIHQVSVKGGISKPALELDTAAGETSQRFPHFLADGRHFTFSSLLPRNEEGVATYVTRLDSRERSLLGSAVSGMILAAPDLAVFSRGTSLMAQRCNRSNWTLIGEPTVIGRAGARRLTMGAPAATASQEGVLVFPGIISDDRHIGWVSRKDGHLSRLAIPAGPWQGLYLGPDGRQAVGFRLIDYGTLRMWMIDTVRGTAVPFGGESFVFGPALWSPDGREVFYGRRQGGRQDLFARPVAGGAERVVYENEVLFKAPVALSPDGRHIVFRQLDTATLWDYWYIPTTGGQPTRFIAGPGEEMEGDFSPDGRWIVYVSNETGRAELYVAAFPSGEGRIQITSGGGAYPKWVDDTWEILYIDPANRVMSIDARPGTPPQFSEPKEQTFLPGPRGRYIRGSVTSDGTRILTSWNDDEDQPPTMTILTNWQGMVSQ